MRDWKRWVGGWLGVLLISGILAPTHGQAETPPTDPPFITSLIHYPGPLYIFVFDVDGNILPIQGDGARTIRVFRWEDYTSPFSDPTRNTTPAFIDIPMADWERGVESKIRAYHRTPLKFLFGHYETAHPGLTQNIRNPGNSFEDEPIRLSNGIEINPRDYYVDPKRSYAEFRTGETLPLLNAFQKMTESGNFGPVYPIFKMVSSPEFPAMTLALTMGGNAGFEWSLSTDHLIEKGHLDPGSGFDRVFALSNPATGSHDPASVSPFMRAETSGSKRKTIILEYLIDHVLSRRIDRTHGSFPQPNVLTYFEDTLPFVTSAAELFERKIRGIRSVDERGAPGAPPIKLVIANTAPLSQYQSLTPAQTSNPQALSSGSTELASIMVYQSDFILGRQSLVERINRKSLDGVSVEALKQTFNVSEAVAKAVLKGEAPCSVLLTQEPKR